MSNKTLDWSIQNTFCSKCHRIPSECCCRSAKQLTDEQIKEVWIKRPANTAEDVIAFARAIIERALNK
jgi:hypothetical protein